MNNLVAFKTIISKEVTRFLRIWVQTLLPPAITMALYFVIFGNLVGKQIAHIQGFSYMQFIAPGLIMMAVITNSYINSSSSFFSAKFQRSIEEMLVAPMSAQTMMLGYIFSSMLRGIIVGFIVMLTALFFTHLHIHHMFIIILTVALTAAVFSLAGLLNGIYARKFDDVSIVPTFVLTPLTYLGGVFYSVDLLPSFWKTLSMFNPILYIVNAFRYGILGLSDVHVTSSIAAIIFVFILLYIAVLRMLHKGVGLKS